MDNESRATRYYDAIAPEYNVQMEASSASAWTRDAFHEFVMDHVVPNSLLLDFGCGTGIDAASYVRSRHRVIAYDSSSGMICQLRSANQGAIERGELLVCEGSFDNLLSFLVEHGPVDAVVSNFAVLNLIADVESVFHQVASHVRPGGHFVASVLNPVCWKELKQWSYWPSLVKSLGRSSVHISGNDTELYRHWLTSLRRAARPHFTLETRASVGTLIRRRGKPRRWAEPDTAAEQIERMFWHRFPMDRLGEFLFLGFRRSS